MLWIPQVLRRRPVLFALRVKRRHFKLAPQRLLKFLQALNQQRIKHAAFAVQDHRHCLFMAVCGFVDALTDECIVHIRQRNDLRRNRDFVPHQTVGIAAPIIALVVPAANVACRAHQLLVVVRRKVVSIFAPRIVCCFICSNSSGVSLPGLFRILRQWRFYQYHALTTQGQSGCSPAGSGGSGRFGTQHLQKPLRQLPHMLHMRAVLTVPELHHMAQDVNQQHVVLFFFEDLARDH